MAARAATGASAGGRVSGLVVKWTRLKGVPVDSDFKIFDRKMLDQGSSLLKMPFPQHWTFPFCPGKPHLVKQHTQLIPLP